MILTIPTIFLEKGKSLYSIEGLPEFSKLEHHFKTNPLELAKLFREENNKSILVSIDNTEESIEIIRTIITNLDIPIQVFTRELLSPSNRKLILSLKIARLFDKARMNCFNSINYIPVCTVSEIETFDFSSYERIMIDFEGKILSSINLKTKNKLSVLNADSNTKNLIKLNITKTNIDSVYLGKEYYGVHFAGQKLWRIAEKAQFNI